MSKLLQPIKLGKIDIQNRILLSPIWSLKADSQGVPSDLIGEYYQQRSSFGLIVAGNCGINKHSYTLQGLPHIYSEDQVKQWKKITDKVHQKGGKIMMQLHHPGRLGIKKLNGVDSVAPSPVRLQNKHIIFGTEFTDPQELTKQGINNILEDFKNASKNAKNAGFDGISIQSGNGLLVDQFLREITNKRTDEYGGSIQNRSRFLLQVIDKVREVYDSGRIAVRLSPTCRVNEMYDSNPLKLLQYLLPELDKKNLAFIEIKKHFPKYYEVDWQGKPEDQIPNFYQTLRPLIKQTKFVGNQGISVEEAKQLVDSNILDAVSFGTLGISNPDLPIRILNNYPINDKEVDISKFVSTQNTSEGYTDFPFYQKQ